MYVCLPMPWLCVAVGWMVRWSHTATPGSYGGQTGEICLDILKTAWSPAWTLLSVCQAVLALLSDPAPDSPLNCDAGEGCALKGGGCAAALSACFCRATAGTRMTHTHDDTSLSRALPCVVECGLARLLSVLPAGNLLRGGDVRGYNSLAKMYTIDHAMQAAQKQQQQQ